LFVKIPKGFIPDQDHRSVGRHSPKAAQGTSLLPDCGLRAGNRQARGADPNVDFRWMAASAAHTASNLAAPTTASSVVHLKKPSQRKLGVEDIIN